MGPGLPAEKENGRRSLLPLAFIIAGAPLSVLDGVPIAIKDEIDCLPHKTTGGPCEVICKYLWIASIRTSVL
jgi:hypothetical protein